MGEHDLTRPNVVYPALLGLAGLIVALAVVLPFRSVPFTRSDGVVVKLPAPDRLNHTSDTWDYLQIAREIYRSHRYESLFTYVPFLPDWDGTPVQLRSRPFDRFPVLWRQPGFPLLIAGAFALRGAPDPDVLPWIQGIAIVLLPLVTYWLALSCVGPGWAGCAGLLVLLCPLVMSPASPWVATTWFAVLVTLLAAGLVRANRTLTAVIAGMLLGLAVIFRLETWMLLPGLLLMLWLGTSSNRALLTAFFLGAALLVLIPWYRCRYQCAGESFTLSSLIYHATDTFPGWTSSRTLAVRDLSPLGFISDHLGEVLKKTGLNVLRYGRDLALLPSPFLAPFVWLAVLRPPSESRAKALVLGTALSAAVLVLVLSPLEYSPRFLAALVPLFTLAAAVSMSRLPRYRRELAAAALVVGLVLTGGALAHRGTQGTARIAAEDLNRLMARPETQSLRRGDAVTPVALCDAPTIFAWIWEGRAVWTPLPQDVPRVREMLQEFAVVALFTRAGGKGDDLAPDTVEGYVNTGGMASAAVPPLVMVWPDSVARTPR